MVGDDELNSNALFDTLEDWNALLKGSPLDQVIDWMFLLDEEERKIVWMRAEKIRWKTICWNMGIGRTKATEIRNKALLKICTSLNTLKSGKKMSEQKSNRQNEHFQVH